MSARAGIWVEGGRLTVKEARALLRQLQELVGKRRVGPEELPLEWRTRLREFMDAFCAAARARGYRVSPAELIGPQRREPLNRLRQLAMAMAHELGASNPIVGLFFGGREHTTVIHARQAVRNRLETEPSTAREVLSWRRELLGQVIEARPDKSKIKEQEQD